MKQLTVTIILLFITPLSASADTTGKVATLMKAQGMLEMWQQQIEMGKVAGKQQADKMLEQFMSQLSPSKEFKKRFTDASDKFLAKLQGNWTAEDIVAVWAKYYGPKFSESELDQLISFYTSEIGQKDVRASKATLVEFSRHFQKENEVIMKKAIDEYIQDLQIVAKECNCMKKK